MVKDVGVGDGGWALKLGGITPKHKQPELRDGRGCHADVRTRTHGPVQMPPATIVTRKGKVSPGPGSVQGVYH